VTTGRPARAKGAPPGLCLLRSQPGWQMSDLADPSVVITHFDASEEIEAIGEIGRLLSLLTCQSTVRNCTSANITLIASVDLC
jgi:hypothetical protein